MPYFVANKRTKDPVVHLVNMHAPPSSVNSFICKRDMSLFTDVDYVK